MTHYLTASFVATALYAIAGCGTISGDAPTVVNTPTVAALQKIPRPPGERVAVSIYEFRSTVGEIPARGATDMFLTALVQSGQFRVVERARLNEGVMREKQLNAAGMSGGDTAQQVLRSARYLFDGAITKFNPGETQRSGSIGVAGAQFGGSSSTDVIGIDVRVVDVATGDIVSVVSVSKNIASDAVGVSGIGNLIVTALERKKGRVSPYTPDLQMQQQRRESLDAALRAAINQAVVELAAHFPQ